MIAGNVEARTDYECDLSCTTGSSSAGNNATELPPPGIFNPPYLINNDNTQLNIITKVNTDKYFVFKPVQFSVHVAGF